MKLKWMWRWCPCRKCGFVRFCRMIEALARKDIEETTGVQLRMGIKDEFAERRTNYAYATSKAVNHGTRGYGDRKSYTYWVFDPRDHGSQP